jgi:hypothetical protein
LVSDNSSQPEANMNQIGQLNEQPLHHALKLYYAGEEGRIEVHLAGYVIDVVLGDQLVEIQTGNFSSIRQKLHRLIQDHPVRVVYPIAVEKWIVKEQAPGQEDARTRRKSPKRGRDIELFKELVSFPELMLEPNFTMEIALIQEEQVREYHEGRYWRQKGWKTTERRLLNVVECRSYSTPQSMAEMLPEGLPSQFTTAELAEGRGISRRLAQKMAYCLRQMEVLEIVGKRGRSILYALGGK